MMQWIGACHIAEHGQLIGSRITTPMSGCQSGCFQKGLTEVGVAPSGTGMLG